MHSNSYDASWFSCSSAILLFVPALAIAAPVFSIANYPLFLAPAIRPNVMIILDNSESMDALMSGMMISGDDPSTRGNIARAVLREIIQNYRGSFNWGLTTFETTGDTLYATHSYYLGDATTMVYTNDCVAGISVSTGGLRCVANPDASVNGFSYITYKQSSDDANVNDVLYSHSTARVMYGVGSSGTSYFVRGGPRLSGTSWTLGSFPVSGPFGPSAISFSPTDAGHLPQVSAMPRQIWMPRGWGYAAPITGGGNIVETVQSDSSAHFNKIISLISNETKISTGEIKNSAYYTPLTGSVQTVAKYFNNTAVGKSSPIIQACQRNFVVLATDGNPTGKTIGDQYDPSQWINVETPPGSGMWAYGQAQKDLFVQLSALRTTSFMGKIYDIQTYVVGMGETVANPSSIAALNQMALLGGGYPTAFLGSDAAALRNSFQSIVGDIQAKTSAASSVALNGGSWNSGSALYQAKFSSSDWSGDLVAFPVESDGSVSLIPTWESASRIKAQNWNTQRNVLTYKSSAALGAHGIPFRWPVNPGSPTARELDPTQTNNLNQNMAGSVDGFGSSRLSYLRGDISHEVRSCSAQPCITPQFRNRNVSPLGDIVNSSPYYVGATNFGYYDDFEPAPYGSFVAINRTRMKIIYFGANDGMLHAINAESGDEVFAYVPSMVYPTLNQLTDLNYSHRFYVDGSPTVGDVFYSGAWHSLLVAGMRSGAKGVYALDVTSPSEFSESNAADIVRWEFSDPDMGYVFGQPLVVKTNNGRWSVIVSGGYNAGNVSGHAFLFVIDAETGALVAKIDTSAGTPISPNGLSSAAAIDANGDGIADWVYAGDLNGNLWKFDLSSASSAAWGVGNGGSLPLFVAPSGQSITARPDVTKFPSGGYLIGFGTGRYLAATDIPDLTIMSEYGIRDTLVSGTVALTDLQEQEVVATGIGADGNSYRLSTHAVGPPTDLPVIGDNGITQASFFNTKKGWYINLPDSGERVVADAKIRGGRIVFTSLTPDVSDPCAFGGSGWVMEFDATTGNRLDTATFDTNGDNTLISAGAGTDYLSFSGEGSSLRNASGRRIGAIPATPGFMGNRNGTTSLEDKYLNTSEGNVVRLRETAGKGGEARVMWREVR